jgi:Family of unknown function (DUF5990)
VSDRTLRLSVRWTAPPPGVTDDYQRFLAEHGIQNLDGVDTEFGMQCGRSEVIPGTPQPDGSIAFEAQVEPYRDKAGRPRFRSKFVQGPPNEPFLYLSWRLVGEVWWIARTKIARSLLTEELIAALPENATLETEASRFGHRTPGHVHEWRAV